VIISRTPFRISFFGGGTDYPVWYKSHGGRVLSVTINKYSYINARWLPPFFDYKHRVRYYRQEEVNSIDEISHPSVRECARFLDVQDGLEVVHNADLPARSGLGSSSTFTVGLLHALSGLQNRMPTKRELAVNAIRVEQHMIGEAVGSQDQIAAAFGGLNYVEFGGPAEFEVTPVILSSDRVNQLQEQLLLCFTGFSRTASDIASHQISNTPHRVSELRAMDQLCREALNILVDESADLRLFGELLNQQWSLKQKMSDLISSAEIDSIHSAGIEAGATGAKLLGAGGGGFMLFYAPKDKHEAIRRALPENKFVPFRFEWGGSKIVYHSTG
jgi:D-glycero-alpha-D-manno-heptose-7-phosphate kinase